MNVFPEFINDPFVLDDNASEEPPTSLTNIATGNSATRLLNSQSIGSFQSKSFLSEKKTNTEDIMAPVPLGNLKTFSSLRKPVKVLVTA